MNGLAGPLHGLATQVMLLFHFISLASNYKQLDMRVLLFNRLANLPFAFRLDC